MWTATDSATYSWNRNRVEEEPQRPGRFSGLLLRFIFPPSFLPILQHRSVGMGSGRNEQDKVL